MTTQQHTPGPWRVGPTTFFSTTRCAIRDSNKFFICEALKETEQERANARLIAAAPELLEALQFLVDECTVTTESENDAFLHAQDVINKVTGG